MIGSLATHPGRSRLERGEPGNHAQLLRRAARQPSENFGDDKGPYVELIHGRIRHGAQYHESPYSHPAGHLLRTTDGSRPGARLSSQTAVAVRQAEHPDANGVGDRQQAGTLRIGVIGLGMRHAGRLWPAGRHDSFLRHQSRPSCESPKNTSPTARTPQATVTVVPGDARINLERELAADSRRSLTCWPSTHSPATRFPCTC